MPIDASWFVVTIPRKEHEKSILTYNLKAAELEDVREQTYIKNNVDKLAEPKPNNLDNFLSCEKILADAFEYLNITEAVWCPTKNGNYFHVYFLCELDNNDHTMQYLKSKGIGTRNNSAIGYIPFGLFYYNEKFDPNDPYNYNQNYFNEIKDSFLKSVTSRLTVAQVVEGVKSGCEMTFDYYMYLLCACTIASMAFMNNDGINLAASMMIEPLMGAVMAISFGLALWDKDVILTGLKSLASGLIFCLLFGFLYGLLFLIWRVAWHPPPDGTWPTGEMQSDGEYKTLIYGAVIATAGGAVLAVILLKNNICAMTGVAVATTFMPPFVNGGLCFALAAHLQMAANSQQYQSYNFSGDVRWLKPAYAPAPNYDPSYSYDMRIECLILAAISFAYTFVNVFCLGLSGFIVLKIKEIIPLHKIAPTEHKFFTEDLKVYKAYRKRRGGSTGQDNMGQDILEEWADISGLNKKELMNNTPEAKLTQIQTLTDIAQDVEADANYRSITQNAWGGKRQPALHRRLTQASITGLQTLGPSTPGLQLANNVFALNPNRNSVFSAAGSESGRKNSSIRNSFVEPTGPRNPHTPYSVWPGGIRHRSPSILSSSAYTSIPPNDTKL